MVIDPVFGEPAAAAADALGPGGRLVNLGGAAGDRTDFSSAGLRGKSIAILGYTNNAITSAQRAAALGSVLELASDGKLEVSHVVRPLTSAPRRGRKPAGRVPGWCSTRAPDHRRALDLSDSRSTVL